MYKMKVAVVLYGQPRDYVKGYNSIMSFIKTQEGCDFDFFYHVWKLNENEEYKHSPWRNIDKNTLVYNEKTITNLQKMYNPVSFEIENQNQLTFDESLYKNTIAFNNTTGKKLLNINNTLFQLYSRNKARNLLVSYLNKMNNSVHYDFVITTRFDISVMPKLKLLYLDTSKTYHSNLHCPRKIIHDHCIIMPKKIFIEWFDIYERLKDILNNKDLISIVHSFNEKLDINPEELMFAKYLLHYKNVDNIQYFNGGYC